MSLTSKISGLLFSFLLVVGCQNDPSEEEPILSDSILSAAVSFQSRGTVIESFLEAPSLAYVAAYFLVPENLASDVVFGLDLEWFEGVDAPLNFPGADWMGLVGLTNEGILWYPTGLPENASGTPTTVRNWQVRDLGWQPAPGTWYRMQITVDYSLLEFVSVHFSGDEVDLEIDLRGEPLDYPNYAPFDLPSLTSYAFAARSKELAPENPEGSSVYFDDISVAIQVGQQWVEIFADSFEDQSEIQTLPVTLPVIPMEDIKEGIWYYENENAKLSFAGNVARSGNRSLECRADLSLAN